MAAPTPSARVTPVGAFLEDGFSTKITIGLDTNISFWEKTVTPPGLDVGERIALSTMFNVAYRTWGLRQLIDLTEASGTAAYDPLVYPQIVAIIGEKTTITVTFSNGDTLAFFGGLRTFVPQSHEEGSQPEANFTISPTNRDSSGVEQAPVYTPLGS